MLKNVKSYIKHFTYFFTHVPEPNIEKGDKPIDFEAVFNEMYKNLNDLEK